MFWSPLNRRVVIGSISVLLFSSGCAQTAQTSYNDAGHRQGDLVRQQSGVSKQGDGPDAENVNGTARPQMSPVLHVEAPACSAALDGATAVVTLLLLPNGRVGSSSVTESTSEAWSVRVLDAVRRWRFTPHLNAQGVPDFDTVTIPFQCHAATR